MNLEWAGIVSGVFLCLVNTLCCFRLMILCRFSVISHIPLREETLNYFCFVLGLSPASVSTQCIADSRSKLKQGTAWLPAAL